jgi:hypothetical protein
VGVLSDIDMTALLVALVFHQVHSRHDVAACTIQARHAFEFPYLVSSFLKESPSDHVLLTQLFRRSFSRFLFVSSLPSPLR